MSGAVGHIFINEPWGWGGVGWREACCRPGAFGRSQAGIKGSGLSHRRNARALKAQYSCSLLGRLMLVCRAEARMATYRS